MVTPQAKKACAQAIVKEHNVSERRACVLVGVYRSLLRYSSRKLDETELTNKIKEIAYEKKRFGYRRIHVILKRYLSRIIHKR